MMDLFTECLIKRKKGLKEYGIISLVILAGLLITYLYLGLRLGMFAGIAFAVVVIMWWGIYIVITKQNLEYEYTVTNSDVDIDMIISQRERKRLASFNIKDIEVMAPINRLKEDNFAKTIDASAHDSRYDVYYIGVVVKGERTKILLNPTEKILEIFETFRPDRVMRGEE